MANTTYGPFVPGASTSTGSYGTGVGQVNTYTSGNANNDETQASVALHSFNQHLLVPFVLQGIGATKDGVTPNQLDVTAGVAYLTMTDSTLGRIDTAASTGGQFLTTAPSVTYYLDLNPDGTWSFATSHSAQANYLPCYEVTTDGSGNIATVTDKRFYGQKLLSTLAGDLTLGSATSNVNILANLIAAGSVTGSQFNGNAQYTYIVPLLSGPASELVFQAWNGSASSNAFGIGNGTGVPTYITPTGAVGGVAGQATAGSFGVPVIVAQALDVNVTVTTTTDVLTYTAPADGTYRMSGYVYVGNATSEIVQFRAVYTSPRGLGQTVAQMAMLNTGAANAPLLNAVGASIASIDAPTNPVVFRAKNGTSIIARYQNPGGTPNDFVTAIIERLS